mmetsp:Transcript_19404/g.45126  ORF Transcript_19404/g.45126 Transcript_19404/m.45126 type:complete len:222 (+) Transcript_19404:104-769(+)
MALFDYLDRNRDGVITRSEFSAAVGGNGYQAGPARAYSASTSYRPVQGTGLNAVDTYSVLPEGRLSLPVASSYVPTPLPARTPNSYLPTSARPSSVPSFARHGMPRERPSVYGTAAAYEEYPVRRRSVSPYREYDGLRHRPSFYPEASPHVVQREAFAPRYLDQAPFYESPRPVPFYDRFESPHPVHGSRRPLPPPQQMRPMFGPRPPGLMHYPSPPWLYT